MQYLKIFLDHHLRYSFDKITDLQNFSLFFRASLSLKPTLGFLIFFFLSDLKNKIKRESIAGCHMSVEPAKSTKNLNNLFLFDDYCDRFLAKKRDPHAKKPIWDL